MLSNFLPGAEQCAGRLPHLAAGALTLMLLGAPAIAAPRSPAPQSLSPPPPAISKVDHLRRVFRDPEGKPLPFANSEEIREFLAHAEVIDSQPIGSGSTRPERLTLERDGVRARAAFRTVSYHDDNVRLREGPEYLEFFDRAIHEVAAYELALLLGLDTIPPVVQRTLGGRSGTVQIWIENAVSEDDRRERKLEPPNAAAWREQQQIMRVFDALVANTDRNTGNRIYDQNWNLWMIDHTRAFQRPRGNDDFSRVQQLPAALLESLRNLDHEQVRRRLGDYLEPAQIISMLRRHGRLMEYIEGLIAERGAGAVVISQRPGTTG